MAIRPSAHFTDSWMPDWLDWPEAISLDERLADQARAANSEAVLDALVLSSDDKPKAPPEV